MEDSPELVKLLKYILFGYLVLIQVPVISSLLPESPQPPHRYSDPFGRSDVTSSEGGHQNGDLDQGHYKRINRLDQEEEMRMRSMMAMDDAGGMRPILEKVGGSLCSIFKTFLEPRPRRRLGQRCQVGPQGPRYRRLRPRPRRGRGPRRDQDQSPLPPLGSNGILQDSEGMSQHEMEMRMMAMMMNGGGGGHPGQMMTSGKRYDDNYHDPPRHAHLDEEQINNSGEEGRPSQEGGGDPDDHDDPSQGHGPMGHDLMNGDIDPTKISQDRTMILVPERGCPSGQRRDSRGYCRRLVKIRTNLQYGPPPLPQRSSSDPGGRGVNGVVRPIPIRYYYSRIVSIPAFQFFYPNVRV